MSDAKRIAELERELALLKQQQRSGRMIERAPVYVETALDGAGNEVPICAFDGCRGCGQCIAWSERKDRR